MPRQRGDPTGIAAPGAKHAGDMHQGFHLRHVDKGHELLLAAVAQQILKQPGLRVFHQLRHGNGGIDVRHRVVGIAVLDAVGARQVFQPEAGQPFLIFRPVNALRTQGITGAHDVEQIPA